MRLAIALSILAASPAFAEDTPINIKDPATFELQLREMGYAPDPFKVAGSGRTASTTIHLKDETLAIALGGCTMGKDCTYLVVTASFVDVLNAPAQWVADRNADYDLIKVWTGEGGKLSYSAGAIVDGMPRASFRKWIDMIVESTDELGSEAVKAGYGPKQK